MEDFRTFLLDWLDANGWNVPRLARASGVADAVIRRWINRPLKRPSDANLRKIAPPMGVSYEQLAKMCGYLPDGAIVRELDPIEAAIRSRADEMREAVEGTPPEFWATIIKATFDRAIDGARDMAHLLAQREVRASSQPANRARADESISSSGSRDAQIDAYQRGMRHVALVSI